MDSQQHLKINTTSSLKKHGNGADQSCGQKQRRINKEEMPDV